MQNHPNTHMIPAPTDSAREGSLRGVCVRCRLVADIAQLPARVGDLLERMHHYIRLRQLGPSPDEDAYCIRKIAELSTELERAHEVCR